MSVQAQDFVSWPSSRGVAKGIVKSVHKGKVPAVPTKVMGNDIEPAARVEQYDETDKGWTPTGRYLGMSSSELTKIDPLPAPATTEAVVSGSFDAIRQRVQAAIEDMLEAALALAGAGGGVFVYVTDIGPDWAVYSSGYDDDQYRVDYTIDGTAVTLGAPVEVQAVTTYTPVAEPITPELQTESLKQETVTIAGHLLEAKGEDSAGGRIFGVRIIANGDSKNMRRYPAAVLAEAAPLYEGAKAYDHHRSEAELRTSTINGLVGSYRNVEAQPDGIYGDLHLLPSATHTAEALDASLAAQADGLPGLVGISHDVMASYRTILEGGKRLAEATKILTVNSADVVADPAAGGRATRFVAGGIEPMKENAVEPEELLAALKALTPEQLSAAGFQATPAEVPAGATEATLIERDGIFGQLAVESAVKKAGLPESFTEAVIALLPDKFTEAELVGQMGSIKGVLGSLEKANLAPTVPSLEVGQESLDKKVAGLDKALNGDYSVFRSFKEAFMEISGVRPKSFLDSEDFNRRVLVESLGKEGGYDSGYRSTESVTSATWNTILGDSVTRRMIAQYNLAALAAWRLIVSSMVPVNDFRTQRIERMGGYGTLPGVNQGAPYQALTTPTNEEVTYGLSKRGGTEDLTLETIANDDLRAVAQIPIKLGQAASQTIYRFVLDMIQTNSTCSYDSTALFAAGHNNLDAGNTLSQTNLSVARRRLLKQTEYGDTTEFLSNMPKYLMVPPDLEELAYQLCNSAVAIPATPAGPTNTPNIHQGLDYILVPYWSALASATWYLVADPSMTPTIELGFYQGKQDPDLLVQADPTVGSVFSSDKITYKIRHIYSGTVLDHRGFYRGN